MYITSGETYLRFDNIEELKNFFPVKQSGIRKTKDLQSFICIKTDKEYNGIDLDNCQFPIYLIYTRIKAGYDIEYKPISIKNIKKSKEFYENAIKEFNNLLQIR